MNNTVIPRRFSDRADDGIAYDAEPNWAYLSISHSFYIGRRCIRKVSRQPAYILIMIAQSLIWLIFTTGVFRQVVHLRGFPAHEYVDYLTPGVAAMSALFSGGMNGVGMLRDIQHGVVDQLLTLPTRRIALIAGRLFLQLALTLVQSTVIVCVAWALGAHFANGVAGMAVLYGFALLLGMAFAVLSNAGALLLRNEETFSVIMNFLLLPVTFLSTAFMPEGALAHWIAAIARYNPLNWAAAAGRIAIAGSPDWASVLRYGSYLMIFVVCCTIFSGYALLSYRRAL
jgi:ABC-2 type transport system permease protein